MKVGVITLMTALLFALPALAGTDPCTGPDTDGDGTVDICDNCSEVSNAGQYDGDQDGFGDACDCDYSATANGVCDGLDFGQFAAMFGKTIPPAPTTQCEFDHVYNGAVDGIDFGKFAAGFGIVAGQGPACMAVPGVRGTPCPTPGTPCP